MENSLEIFTLRHSLLKYNKATNILTPEEKAKSNVKFAYNKDFVNSDLDEKGEIECNKFVEKHINNNEIKNIKYIFVSPFYRCAKTLKNLKKILIDKKIIILPTICESFSSIANIFDDKNIKEELKDFDVDYKYYDEWIEKYGYHFNLFLCEKTDLIKESTDLIKDKKKLYIKELLYIIERENIKTIETVESLFNRSTKSKEFLKKFSIENSLKSKEILIISHGNFLMSFNATKLENGKLNEVVKFKNLELNKIKI